MHKEKAIKAMSAVLLTFALVVAGRGAQHLTASSQENTTMDVSSTATMQVDPSTITVEIDQAFSVNINIQDVVDLYGWEFKLRWNATLLKTLNVVEGGFLKDYNDTLFVININNTEGYLRAACTLMGYIAGVNGTGILATVEFNPESEGESALILYDTKLVNSNEQPISHTTNDGQVIIRLVDSPPNGGEGGRKARKLLR